MDATRDRDDRFGAFPLVHVGDCLRAALKDESDQCVSAETRENADSVEDHPKNAVGKLWIEERVLASEKKPRKSNRKKQTNGQVEINVRIGWTA